MTRVYSVGLVCLMAGMGLGQAAARDGWGEAESELRGIWRSGGGCEEGAGGDACAPLASVDVRERGGKAVKKGQQLAKLDDAIQRERRWRWRNMRRRRRCWCGMRIEPARLGAHQHQWDKVKNNQGFSPEEKRQKELDVKQAQRSGWRRRRREQTENQIKLLQEQNRLDHMTIRSPIDGYVVRVNKQAGGGDGR